MPKKSLPNAWEDDWETQADRAAAEDTETGGASLTEEPVVLSRAERLAKHEEEQRKLWKSADEPEEFHFLAATNSVPFGGVGIKPAMKVLSRKPAPQVIKRRDPVTGLEQLTIRDDAAEAAAEAEAEAARNQLTPEQIRQRQQREREEKQRKYDEARAKIFGEPLPSKSSSSAAEAGAAAASASPSRTLSRQGSPQGSGTSSPGHNGRGRGRGGRGGNHGGNHRDYRRTQQQQQQQQQQQAGGYNNTGGAATAGTRELYDPNYSARPCSHQNTRRGGGNGSGSDIASPGRSRTPREDDFVIRTPRGPDGSGRGGFGFAKRGG